MKQRPVFDTRALLLLASWRLSSAFCLLLSARLNDAILATVVCFPRSSSLCHWFDGNKRLCL